MNYVKKFLQSHLHTNYLLLIVFVLADFLAILFAASLSYSLRFSLFFGETFLETKVTLIDYRIVLLLLTISWLSVFGIGGLYAYRSKPLSVIDFQSLIRYSFIFFFSLGFACYVFKIPFSRGIFILMFFVGMTSLITTRLLLYFIVVKPLLLNKKYSRRLLIVGRNMRDSQRYSDWIIANRLLGYLVVSRMECSSISSEWLEEFERILKFNPIDEILMLPGMESDKNFSRFIHYCEDLRIRTNWIPLESGNLGYWLIPRSQVGNPFLAFSPLKISVAKSLLKRIFDICFAILALILLSPVYLVISLLVVITTGRPVFYSQKRVGLNGKVFNFYKFRSMVKNADQLISSADNVHAKDHVIFKDKKDPRVTPIGRILRRYSLDELPQFFNVLINDMSVVGPRPALVHEVKKYDSMYERRLNAKPGVTGPWQISGRSDLDLQTSVALDLNYMVNWSFTRDLWIIIATIGAVFKGRGAY